MSLTFREGEATLLERISQGDETAFRSLFDLYYDKLLHVAFYFLRSKEFSEEAVSDVFYTIWKRRSTLPMIEDIGDYLFVSVKNQALHYLRRGYVPENDNLMELYQVDFLQDADTPELSLIDKEYQQLIQKAINSLPDKCREVFRLVISDKLKNREISALLNISEKTVEAHITRAYKRIAEYVNKEYKSEG